MAPSDPGDALEASYPFFPSTHWSQLLEPEAGERRSRSGSWDWLAERYWKPVYACVRFQWARTTEDARDLTQEFFLWMMESDFLGRTRREGGRFRSLLKVALRHYLVDDRRRRRTQKRGAGRLPTNLAGKNPPLPVTDPKGKTPDQVLDEAWREELLTRAVSALEDAYRNDEKDVYFRVFHEYLLSDRPGVTYEEVASSCGIGVRDVGNYLLHAKKAFRTLLKGLVAETVADPGDLADELRALFGEDPS